MRNKAAFTLLELVVVLTITAGIIGIGIQGMIIFRQTVEFQQAQIDVTTVFTSVRNLARNSVASQELLSQGNALPSAQVDGYAFLPGNGNYSIYYCLFTDYRRNQVNCFNEQENLKPAVLNEVSVNIVNPDECRGVFIARATTDMAIITQVNNATLEQEAECDLEIIHNNNSLLNRRMRINALNDSLVMF